MDRRRLLGLFTASVATGLAGCTARSGDVTREVVERTFEPGDVATVSVTNDIGDVTVQARETDAVGVRVVKRSTAGDDGLADIDVSAEERGGSLAVTTAIADDAGWFSRSSPSTDTTVTVPAEAGPEITEIESNLGDVTLLGTTGDTRVRTRLGRVFARSVDGSPSLVSELGDVIARRTTGLGDVATRLGEVDVDLLAVRDRIEIRTELGDLSIAVGPDAAFDLVVESNGDIVSDLSLSNVQTGSNRLAGEYNGGGPRVRVVTEVGDVLLGPVE